MRKRNTMKRKQKRGTAMADSGSGTNNIGKNGRRLLCLLLFIPCFFTLVKSLDNDIWFLLNHGRYVLANGIPHIEPFTIHEGFKFVMQQWLSAVMFWLAYTTLGDIGVKLIVLVCYILLVFIIYKICLMISDDNFLVSFFATFLVSVVFVFFMVTRPYVFSSLIFAGEFFLLESYRKKGKRGYLLFLPLLSALLINLHAAMWPMMFIFIAPYAVESFRMKIGRFTNPGAEKTWLFLSIAISVAAGFLNPYGLDAMLYLTKSYGYEQIGVTVSEMRPVNINTPFGKIVLLCLLIVPLVYVLYKKGKLNLRYILLALGTGYMVMSSYRNLFMFALCAYFPLSAYLKDWQPCIKTEFDSKKTLRIRALLIILIVALVPLAFYGGYEAEQPRTEKYILLNKAIDQILEDTPAEKVVLYTGYNSGGMAEFRGLRTYMDARAEVFVKKNNGKADISEEYTNMQLGLVHYKMVLNQYDFTHFIVDKKDFLHVYLPQDGDYKLYYANEQYSVYVMNTQTDEVQGE